MCFSCPNHVPKYLARNPQTRFNIGGGCVSLTESSEGPPTGITDVMKTMPGPSSREWSLHKRVLKRNPRVGHIPISLLFAASSVFAQSPVWTQTSAPNNPWHSLAVSADGSKVVAVAGGTEGPYPQIVGAIYTSTNSGITWDITSAPIASWDGVASSSDGTHLAAAI